MTLIPPNKRDPIELGLMLKSSNGPPVQPEQQKDHQQQQKDEEQQQQQPAGEQPSSSSEGSGSSSSSGAEWIYTSNQVLETLQPISLELVRTELGSLGVHNLYHEICAPPPPGGGQQNNNFISIQWERILFHNVYCPAQLVSSNYTGGIISRALGTLIIDGEVYEPLNDASKVIFSVGEEITSSGRSSSGSSSPTTSNNNNNNTSSSNNNNNTNLLKPCIRMEWSGIAVQTESMLSSSSEQQQYITFRIAMPIKFHFDWQLEILMDGDIHIESPEIQDEHFMIQQLDSNLEELDEGSPILTLYDCGTGDKMTCYRGTSTAVGTPVLFVEVFFSLTRGPQRISQKGMEASDSTLVRIRCDEKDMVVTPGQMLVLEEVKKLFRAFFLYKVIVDPNICMAEVPLVPHMKTAATAAAASNGASNNNGMVAHAPMEMMQD